MRSSTGTAERDLDARPFPGLSGWIARGARIALGVVYLSAALSKMFDPGLFVDQIAGYGVTPAAWSSWQAPLFLFVETVLGVALIVGFRPRIMVPAGVLLILFFVGVLLIAAARGYRGACGCFGQASGGVTQALIEDMVFLALGVVAWAGIRGRGARGTGRRSWQLAAVVIAAAAGVLLPIAGNRLPLPSFVTAAHAGGRFDHVVIEGFEGRIEEGDHLVAILDPISVDSADAVAPLDALATDPDLPPLVGVFQGGNEEMVAFLFAHAPSFDGMGHAPRDALRRYYRRLPVVLALRDGAITSAWHEEIPSALEVKGAYSDAGRR